MELRVHDRTSDGATLLSVSGEVDVASAEQFGAGLHAAVLESSERLVIDMRELGFIDSTGLGKLVAARHEADAQGVRLTLVCTAPNVLRLFQITGLDGYFDIRPDLDPAAA